MRFDTFEQSTSAIHALQNGAIKAAQERENAIRRAMKLRGLNK